MKHGADKSEKSGLKGAALVALVAIFAIAFVLGRKSQTRTQVNMNHRLELTRQRYQGCDKERRMYKGEMKAKEEDEVTLAQEERSALLEENRLLQEDNAELQEENFALEDQIDQLRDELDDRDWVSDDEMSQLEEVMSLGNNSQPLKTLLDDASVLGGINKDDLLRRLMHELKAKRSAARACSNELDFVHKSRQQVMDQDEIQRLKQELAQAKAAAAAAATTKPATTEAAAGETEEKKPEAAAEPAETKKEESKAEEKAAAPEKKAEAAVATKAQPERALRGEPDFKGGRKQVTKRA